MAHSRYVIHVSFSPNGNHLVSASNDKTISLWRMKSSGMEECDDEGVCVCVCVCARARAQ